MSFKRIHVFYSGSVQGVGFRYTAHDIAQGLRLNGWVKNLRDGRVELICEGDEEKLETFLDNLKNGFLRNYIVFSCSFIIAFKQAAAPKIYSDAPLTVIL